MRWHIMKQPVNFGIARKSGMAWPIAALLTAAALAQDVPGIEICTRESRLDRRTSCLQSNVEFLQQVVTKNALDSQQKLSAANREIAALKEQLAVAGRDVAALREALASMEAKFGQLQKAASPSDPQKPPGKEGWHRTRSARDRGRLAGPRCLLLCCWAGRPQSHIHSAA
jgi:septal ring factor EnvC (AmiA/AmiB activator)